MVYVFLGGLASRRFAKHVTDEWSLVVDYKRQTHFKQFTGAIHLTCKCCSAESVSSSYDLHSYLQREFLHNTGPDLLTSNQILRYLSQIDFHGPKRPYLLEVEGLGHLIQLSVSVIRRLVGLKPFPDQVWFLMDGFSPICQLVQVYQDVFRLLDTHFVLFLRPWGLTGWLEHYNLRNNMRVARQCLVVPFYDYSGGDADGFIANNLWRLGCGYKRMFLQDKLVFLDFSSDGARGGAGAAAHVQKILQNIKHNSYRMRLDKSWLAVPGAADDVQRARALQAVKRLLGNYAVQGNASGLTGGTICLFTGEQIAELLEFLEFKTGGTA